MEEQGFFVGGCYGAAADNQFPPDSRFFHQKPLDKANSHPHFTVDDLLDLPKEDEVMTDSFFDNLTGNSADSSTVTVLDSCNSSVSGGDNQFSGNFTCQSFTDSQFSGGELCVPQYDDLAELEWLSNFVEESFSSDELQNLKLISAAKVPADTSCTEATNRNSSSAQTMFRPDVSFPGKARSKRSRAAPCDWSSRLLVLSPASSSSENEDNIKATLKKMESRETSGRKCLHCASEKTPQWRTGPMGPKTLCNACGVRYKSGRLVPEYRPAASPTFMSTKHSNSHRKVIELRRQKEMQRQQQQLLSQSTIFGVSNGDDYLIHRQSDSGFRHMI